MSNTGTFAFWANVLAILQSLTCRRAAGQALKYSPRKLTDKPAPEYTIDLVAFNCCDKQLQFVTPLKRLSMVLSLVWMRLNINAIGCLITLGLYRCLKSKSGK